MKRTNLRALVCLSVGAGAVTAFLAMKAALLLEQETVVSEPRLHALATERGACAATFLPKEELLQIFKVMFSGIEIRKAFGVTCGDCGFEFFASDSRLQGTAAIRESGAGSVKIELFLYGDSELHRASAPSATVTIARTALGTIGAEDFENRVFLITTSGSVSLQRIDWNRD